MIVVLYTQYVRLSAKQQACFKKCGKKNPTNYNFLFFLKLTKINSV